MSYLSRLNLLIWNQSHEEDGNVSVNKTPQSAREARIKLKALNQATIRMSSQLESLEEENRNLKKRNEMVLLGNQWVGNVEGVGREWDIEGGWDGFRACYTYIIKCRKISTHPLKVRILSYSCQ